MAEDSLNLYISRDLDLLLFKDASVLKSMSEKHKEKPRIVLFGNSHVSAFSGQDTIINEHPNTFESDYFQYYCQRLGPCTAYNFFWNKQYYSRVLDILETNNFKNDTVCLLLGEIDCRLHIGLNSEEKSKPLDECIEEVIDRFLLCLLDLKQRGYKVLIIAVQPASTYPPSKNPDGPVHGDFILRNTITRDFNKVLERKSKIHNFLFCSIFDTLMVDEYTPDMNNFMDYVHLRGSIVRQLFDKTLYHLFYCEAAGSAP